MTISNNYVPIRQIGNGSTTQFSAAWAVLSAAYLTVFFEDAITHIQTPVSPSLYTLVFNSAGFTVTFNTAPTSSVYVVIGRAVSLDQTDPYRTSKGFQGSVEEASFDKLTAICQDLSDTQSRTLSVPLGDTATSLIFPAASARALLFAAFDANGNAIAAVPGGNSPISAAMAPVVAASTLAQARAAMGVATSGANTDITSLNGPSLGAATATTQLGSDSTTKVSTTAQVQAAIALIPAASTSTPGLAKVDGLTVTSSSGILSASGIYDATPTANNGASGQTLSAAVLLQRVLVRSTQASATDTTDTASNIIAAISSANVGTMFDLMLVNQMAGNWIINAGSGVSLNTGSGTLVVPSSSDRIIKFRINNVGSASITIF